MIQTKDWISYFPFEQVRPIQEKAINFIIDAIENGDNYIILDLGTGVGKSAIAKTIATYYSIEQKKKSYFLTTQKILQKQYVNDFGGSNLSQNIQSVFASGNYECKFCPGQQSCAETRSTFSFSDDKWISKCKTQSCTYSEKKNSFVNSSLGLTNYAFFLSHCENHESIGHRDLIFHDECHNLEKELSSFVGFEISQDYCMLLNITFCPDTEKSHIFEWVKNNYKHVVNKQKIKSEQILEKRKNAINAEEALMWTQYLDKLNNFINYYEKEPDNWIVNKNTEVISFNPIDVSGFAQEKLFSYSDINILMSATVVNIARYAESLGIEKYAELTIDSPFSYDNRPVYYYPAGSMAMEYIDNVLPTVVEHINNILDMHIDEKGIIHCHSYKILAYIRNNIKNDRLLFQDKNNRDYILQTHKDSEKPTVIVSPSMTEGVDLVDDLSRFQVVCKLPYPYLGDELIKARKEKWVWWYSLETIKTLVQSIGRSIRNEDDTATTYILDGSFDAFIRKNRKLFPSAFLELLEHHSE